MGEKRNRIYENPFLHAIHRDVDLKKRNALIIITGKVGTGKSYVGLKIAETMDPTFNKDTLKDRLVLAPEQFMEMIVRKKNKLRIGQAIMIDEASTQMYNRQWASVNNQMINYILTTFRHRRLICIMTVPYMDFLDSNVRRLFDYYVETKKIDFNGKQTNVKIYELSYNKMKADKPYKKFFRILDKSGKLTRVENFWFDKPSDDLCKQYEDYADTFKNKIAEEALAKAMAVHEKEEKKNVDLDEIVDKILENKKKFFKIRAGVPRADLALIEVVFGLGGRVANRVKKMAEMKAQNKEIINI